jgi:hypothetical protein
MKCSSQYPKVDFQGTDFSVGTSEQFFSILKASRTFTGEAVFLLCQTMKYSGHLLSSIILLTMLIGEQLRKQF